MKLSSSILYSLATILSANYVQAACDYIDGNYYCASVNAVQYTNIGFSGSYENVISMDESTCQCEQESYSFSGTLSPLDEELSVHFRGPLNLKQFGVYYPNSSSSKKKRDESGDCTTTRHVHHQHKRAPAIKYVEVTETVYKDANGNIITYVPSDQVIASDASEVLSTLKTSITTSSTEAATTAFTETSSSSSSTASSSSSSSSSASSDDEDDTATGSWLRSSYYTPGSADNVVFMNSKGGTAGSGVWSSCFGNSISYAASNGVDGASSSQVLNDVTIASDVEYMIFSGSSCSDSSGDCGYYRGDIPAYHGFSGKNKIFVFEFQMPQASDSASTNYDMPAIWLLNAKIPRTLQYGNSECSCWSTGCGELDLFEILSSGSDKLITHIHDGQGASSSTVYGGGGSSDYIARPYDSTMKAAAVFKDGAITIAVLDDSTDFSSSLTSDVVDSWFNTQGTVVSL